MTHVESWAAFGSAVISWTLRSAFLCAIALAALRLLERHSAALRHAVLTAAIVATLALPALSTVRLTGFLPRQPATWVRSKVGAFVASDTSTARQAPMRPALDARFQEPSPPQTSRTSLFLSTTAILWIVVTSLLTLRVAAGLLAARQIRNESRVLHDPATLELFRRLVAQHGMTRAPALRTSRRVAAPATMGCWHAVVLMPEGTTCWAADQLRPVLAHELAHVLRRDCLTTLFGDVACALCWCNPFAWIVARRQRLERERACDDVALATGVDPTRYGRLLLDVAWSANSGAAAPASILMMARPKELESRLLSIVRGAEIARDGLSRRAGIVLALLASSLSSVAASHAPRDAAAVADTTQRAPLEPDRRGDSLSQPSSERIPFHADIRQLAARARQPQLWSGPDSVLVRLLVSYLDYDSEAPQELGRDRAIWALSQARGNQLVEPLLGALADGDWRERTYAAWTLALTRERRAVPALLAALEDRVWRLRAMAAWSLGEIADARALTPMTRALNDEAWQVRWAAVSFVARFADATVAARLLQPRLQDRHAAVRDAAADALTLTR